MSEPEDNTELKLRRFGAALTMAVGGIIATLCGGCAVVFGASMLLSGPTLNNLPLLLIPAVLGGLPALLGWVIFRSGLKLWRRSNSGRNVTGTFD